MQEWDICIHFWLVEGGINYAIFDEKKFDCVGVKVVHIGNIHYEWKEL